MIHGSNRCVAIKAKETLNNIFVFKIVCDQVSKLQPSENGTKAQVGNAYLLMEPAIKETLCMEAAALSWQVFFMDECEKSNALRILEHLTVLLPGYYDDVNVGPTNLIATPTKSMLDCFSLVINSEAWKPGVELHL